MGPFGDAVPKPIAPVCNRPLLAYQLDHLRSIGVRDVLIVIGHLGHHITQALGDGEAYGVRIRYVEQEKRLGLAHAVGQLEPHIDRPFVLMLGDIFFEMDNLAAMAAIFEGGDTAAVLAVKDEPDPAAIRKNFAVIPGEGGLVRRVIEKPRIVPNQIKGCGIYLFDERIFEAVRRTPRTAMRDEYELTDSIQILIDYGYPVRMASIVEWDMNVTFIGDLIECCAHVLRKEGKTSLLGAGATVAKGA
jgi:dTDP-glucose pyrophosphorylase